MQAVEAANQERLILGAPAVPGFGLVLPAAGLRAPALSTFFYFR
jgi:hypothetical protein